ncbi:MAG: heme lyase CcmF/NrfE family subunit [Gemmatimonadaceae bacterium]|jgi:cytochrome c-type biogenesis protein CcmF
MILVGELSLWIALLMCAWAATLSFAGGRLRRPDLIVSGERGLYAGFGFVVLASAGLWTALLTSDFSVRYVASFTSANLPVIYKISAFWGGQAGSMLFWCLVLAGYAALATWVNRRDNRVLMPWVTGTNALVLLFFVATTVFASNPFERLEWVPADGRGLNPQLQNPAMALHPPLLYLGYVATAIPFGFAIAALITRRLDAEWLGAVRRWSLVSWVFLTLGIVLGMWWAYVELGWGGYWMWDPVENASLLPWLTGTAFLHSIMIQEKRGMLRKWNVTLVVTTFLLSILGTFITRSGVIQSVHSFAQSAVGHWFATFFVLALVATVILVSLRLKDLESPAQLEAMISREAAFLYNNLVLVGIAFSVLWGTLFPILSEWVRGTKITVGESFFNAVNVPLGLLLLALTGIGPLIAWRRASVANIRKQFAGPAALGVIAAAALFTLGIRELYPLMTWGLASFVAGTILQEFWKGIGARRTMYGEGVPIATVRLVARNRRRYGGYIVHAGIVILFAAFAGMAFRKEYDVTLRAGESTTAIDPFGRRWTFTSEGLSEFKALNRDVLTIALRPTVDGQPLPILTSEKRQHRDSRGQPTFQPSTEVGILSEQRQDVYLVLAGAIGDQAEIRINFNPLVVWVWHGGILMAIGGLIVMWPPSMRRRRQEGYVAELAPQAVAASA